MGVNHFLQAKMAFIYLLLVIPALVYVNMETIDGSSVTEAPECHLCVDRFNWTECDDSAKPRICSDELVIATHSFLSQYNTNLNRTTSSDRQFKCFRLELEIDVTTVQVFIRGCTYDDSFFCEGWAENGARSINCATCSAGSCVRNTTGDVSSTTTLVTTPVSTVETSSTTPSVPVTTTAAETKTTTTTTTASTLKPKVPTDDPCIVDWTTKKQSTTTDAKVTTTTREQSKNKQSEEHVTEIQQPDTTKAVPTLSGPNPTPATTKTTDVVDPTPPPEHLSDMKSVTIVSITTTEVHSNYAQRIRLEIGAVAVLFLVFSFTFVCH